MIQSPRIQNRTNHRYTNGAVLYWMSRDMRVQENWALLHAIYQAQEHGVDIIVCFNLVDSFLEAGTRQFDFMLRGLREVEQSLRKNTIPFYLLHGSPEHTIPNFVQKHSIGHIITDFSPLRISREWEDNVAQTIDIPFQEVDAHNVIPPWVTSDKQEYAARTIRPKVHNLLDEWLIEIPPIPTINNTQSLPKLIDWDSILSQLDQTKTPQPVDWITPGETAAHQALQDFIDNRLDEYDTDRNKPDLDALSNLSPYIHFGQISTQRIAWEVKHAAKDGTSIKAYLEELIVRRELSENFCYYNPHYDSWESFPTWAKNTLNDHRDDEREYLYSKLELEKALTHDPLWNAAQQEMLQTGKMHGYIRMYWAKKILEWTESPEQALAFTIYLNDKYELDGRDPIGYTNMAWSIGGVHDHGWTERPIFGKIRFMSLASTGRKFNSKGYIEKWTNQTKKSEQTLL